MYQKELVCTNLMCFDLAAPFNLGGHEVFTTASIGIALRSQSYHKPEEVLRDADTAMYHAKALGKARHEIFDHSMHERAIAQLKLETDLRRAIERAEFRLYYQPLVSLASRQITGFEALIRWQHPERGLLPPSEFISVAEETGMIMQMGSWVLQEACRQMHEWQQRLRLDPCLTISVNLSSKQLLQADLVEQISCVLRQTGLHACSLKLEITEGIMEHAEATVAKLEQLRALGIKLHIDDFGTGYSSLSYLYRFPVDTLKIDRSFVSRMNQNGENAEIVQTIVQLAHNLRMEVMAEGVETEEQLVQLKALKCEYGQGYFFSEPVDSRTAGALIAL